MTEEAPTLHLSGTELWQWAQAIVGITQLISRMRQRMVQRREAQGRMANNDAEHAAQLDEARAHPPVRLMTDVEQEQWLRRIPADLASRRGEESVSVWTSRLGEGWGVEARAWTPSGAPAGSLFVVCRDVDDAAELCRWLRVRSRPDDLARLHDLATHAAGRFTTRGPLSEAAWERALRAELPARLADQIIVKDPAHPHHRAWRELHTLANDEVQRMGADPARLAAMVHRVPVWRDTIRNPAALAHWALTVSRSNPGYEQSVRPPTPATPNTAARRGTSRDGAFVVDGAVAPPRRRLSQVHSPAEALQWVTALEANNPEHRLEAKTGFGQWGSQVDAALAAKFDTLVSAASKAAHRQRRRDEQRHKSQDTVVAATAEEPIEPAAQAILAEDIAHLHPAAAWGMLGHVNPELDRLIADHFGDDPRFAAKLRTLYPADGQLDSEAAAYRARADINHRRAAAHLAVPDDPATAAREDIQGRDSATGDQGVANSELAAATAARAQPPRPITVAEPSARRTR